MPWTIGNSGPPIDFSPLARNAALRQQYAAQPNPTLSSLGAGVSQGMTAGIQDLFDQRREARRSKADIARQDAILKRQQELQQERLAADLARQRDAELTDMFSESMSKLGEYATQFNANPAIISAYNDLNNNIAALAGDENVSALASDDSTRQQVKDRFDALRQKAIQLRGMIPKNPSPIDIADQSFVSGSDLNARRIAKIQQQNGGQVPQGVAPMYDDTASYQFDQRSRTFKMVEGTGAEYQAKVQAQIAKAKSEQPQPMTIGTHPAWQGYVQGHPELANIPLDEKGKPLIPLPKESSDKEPDYVSMASKMAGEDSSPDDILNIADKLKDRDARVGERSKEREEIRKLMDSDPENAKFYGDMNKEFLDRAQRMGTTPEAELSKEVNWLRSLPPQNRTPQLARLGMALEKIKAIYDAN